MVTTAIVTTFMKPTPRHCGVFTLTRAPCTLTKKTRVSFPISPIRNQRGVNVLACGISASNRWRSACDLTLTTEKAGDRRLAPRAPLCRRQLQHALSCLWVGDQRRLRERRRCGNSFDEVHPRRRCSRIGRERRRDWRPG